MWVKDLEELEVEYNKFIEATTYSAISTNTSANKAGVGAGGGASKFKKMKLK